MEPRLLRYSKLVHPAGREFDAKTVLITGANSGIGYTSARIFASKGAKVIVVCRTKVKARLAIEEIKSEYEYDQRKENGALPTSDLKLIPMELDLSSLTSAMIFINNFKREHLKLDIMILNAGVAGVKKIITVDGMETHFQVNYLTHFLICLHLVPILNESNGVVMSIASEAHRVLAKFKVNNFQGEKDYGRFLAYGNSKLFQVMAAFSFERRLRDSNIHFICMHPGHVTDTAIGQHMSDMSILYLMRQCIYAVDGFESTVTVNYIVDILKQREFESHTEVYYNCKNIMIASQDARDTDKQDQLWAYSIKMLKDYLPTQMSPELQP